MKSPSRGRGSEDCKQEINSKLLSVHSKALMQCRDLLMKSLNPDIFCSQSILSKIPAVFKQDGYEEERKIERLSQFLENLEQSDDRSFNQFMQLLKEQNKTVHNVLEQTIRVIEDDEGDCVIDDEVCFGERATMTGLAIRDLLKLQKFRLSNRSYEDHTPSSLLDADIRGSDGYVACQVVAIRGQDHEKSWIKHDKRKKVKDSSDNRDPFMAILTKDLIFKFAKVTDIPNLVKKPLNCTIAYVVDEKSLYSPVTVNAIHSLRSNHSHAASTLKLHLRSGNIKSEEGLMLRNVQTPPPLPPKPDSLSPLPNLQLRERFDRNHPNSQTLKADPPPDINICFSEPTPPPPIPARQRVEMAVKPLPLAPNPNFYDKELINMVQISSYPKAFSNFEADDGIDDDNISLNYIIEPEDAYDSDGPYEAIDQNTVNEQRESDIQEELVQSPKLSDMKGEISPSDVETAQIVPENVLIDDTTSEENQTSSAIEDKIENHPSEIPSNKTSDDPLGESTDQTGFAVVSVSRSSSGVSTTVKTRDSGVDSVVSRSLHESPLCAADPSEDLDKLIPEAIESQPIEQSSRMIGVTEPSYYEDIDLMNNDHSSHYLDPRSDEPDIYPGCTLSGFEQKVVPAGTLLMSDYLPACKFEHSSCNEYIDENTKAKLAAFQNTRICYDREGAAYYIQVDQLKKFGDPHGEPWFYPIPLSIKEATLFLRHEKQKGCFLVYVPADVGTHIPEGCFYFISLSGEGNEVVHYPIVENYCGDVMVEGHDRSFLNVYDLVQYFRRNRSCLLTRLRRPLKESRLPIIPGHHYPASFELLRKSVRLHGKIVSEGKFGLTCMGSYGQRQIFVKALQNDSIIEEEDDFLNEALILMNLEHENIIKLVGVCFRSRPFFILTENFGIGSVKESLVNGFFSSDKGDIYFDICVQMISAMAHLEKQRYILHRNLTANNFLLSSNYVIKLFNFERARRVDDDCYCACCDEEVLVRWSPPEVLRDSYYSTKSDVWSLAVVFWELFSLGQLPYGHMSEQEVAVYVTERGKLEKPQDCENFIFSIMLQCWKYRASARPSFSLLESKVKGQCSLYFSNTQRKFSDVVSPIHSSASLSDDLHSNQQFTLKNSKRNSQSGPNTPLLSTPTLNIRMSNLYSDYDNKPDDVVRNVLNNTVKNTRNTLSASSRSAYDRSTAMVDTCSASIPFSHFTNGDVSRGNKMRKSLRNLLKVTKLSKHTPSQ